MKDKSFIHFPAISVLIAQPFALFVSIIAFFSFFVLEDCLTKSILIIVISILIAVQLLLLVLSFFWWNAPLSFDSVGITRKQFGRTKKYFWKDVVDVKIIARGYSKYGPTYVRIIIVFEEGKTIRFEPNSHITKDIFKICKDEYFLNKYLKVIQDD